jgi:diguanylate cyclase (GGDEF)-like protein
MQRLYAALEALSAAIGAPSSLALMIVELERALGRALELDGLRISLGPEDAAAGSDAPAAGTFADVPLVLEGETIGWIRLEFRHGDESAASDSLAVLQLLAAPFAAAIACRQRREERVELGRFARIDGLCRIPNRLAFEERIGAAWARCRERKTSLALALVDIDFFKAFNDRYGHVAGDQCLRRVAALLAEEEREQPQSFAARYGGEEFVVLFEGVDTAGAFAAARAWLERLTSLGIDHAGTTLGCVSASVGVSAVVPAEGRRAVDLIDEADRSLYRAKSLGRNRVCADELATHGPVVTRCISSRDDPSALEPATFGREADLARILAAMRHARLLTLVGPSGIGKSRLLSLVAHWAQNQFERVVYVDSARLVAGATPAAAIAAALDLEVDPTGVLASVTGALAEREALLLFDGVDEPAEAVRAFCEHVLRHAPDVSIAATAVAPLRIWGERTIVVPPLDDEAALALLNFHGGDGSDAMRRIVRAVGGNPAALEEAGKSVASLGATAALASLEERVGAGA